MMGCHTQLAIQAVLAALKPLDVDRNPVSNGRTGDQPNERTLWLIHRLQTILEDGNPRNVVLDCQGEVAQSVRWFLMGPLDRRECETNSEGTLSLRLKDRPKRSKLLPTCYELKNITLENQLPVGAGSFTDIYEGV
ncbi:hypothetical protein H2248_011419 [Termitomyces sp. 'cryptogamus']|nr:hypothetical protein H2248_011419 [Termitomyces sp. 'cryptogamus']